jgi:nicotinamidase/pyrazinamidase
VQASRDWHPRRDDSLQAQGGPWPVHCVQNTPGAEFHPLLDMRPEVEVFSKGMWPLRMLSAFPGAQRSGVTLPERLRQLGVERVYVGGLTLDYCVQFTVLDALAAGLNATVLLGRDPGGERAFPRRGAGHGGTGA